MPFPNMGTQADLVNPIPKGSMAHNGDYRRYLLPNSRLSAALHQVTAGSEGIPPGESQPGNANHRVAQRGRSGSRVSS
jgi:hypothetical protein